MNFEQLLFSRHESACVRDWGNVGQDEKTALNTIVKKKPGLQM